MGEWENGRLEGWKKLGTRFLDAPGHPLHRAGLEGVRPLGAVNPMGQGTKRRPALKARNNNDQFSSVTGALRRAICRGLARTLNTHLQCVSSLGDVSLGLGALGFLESQLRC